MEQDIEQLIRNVQNGDTESFDIIMQKFMHDVRCYLASRVPSQHLINDVALDTFVFAYRNIETFNPEDAKSFLGWLKAIARNYLLAEIQRFKRESKKRQSYHAFVECIITEERRNDYDYDKLNKCLDSLPEKSRTLLTMRYQESRPGKEIAELLGRSHSWVKTNIHRLHLALRDCMLRAELPKLS